MMQKAFRALVILPCAAALILGVSAARAAAVKSETFAIPFAFQVEKQTLPPGEYRVEQAQGLDIAMLVNIKTGQKVGIVRPAATHEPGKVKLVFKGHTLTQIR